MTLQDDCWLPSLVPMGWRETRLPDGRLCVVERLLFGQGRVCVGSPCERWGYDEGWEFRTFEGAVAAVEDWIERWGELLEPGGSVRRLPGNGQRERPHGNDSIRER